jgi:hypothetical protein
VVTGAGAITDRSENVRLRAAEHDVRARGGLHALAPDDDLAVTRLPRRPAPGHTDDPSSATLRG